MPIFEQSEDLVLGTTWHTKLERMMYLAPWWFASLVTWSFTLWLILHKVHIGNMRLLKQSTRNSSWWSCARPTAHRLAPWFPSFKQVMHSLESWRRHIAIYRCTSNPMEAKIYCPGFRFWQFIYFILRFIPHQISMLQIWAVLSQSKTLSFQHLLLSLGLQNPDHFILDVSKNSIELRFATCWVRHSWSRLCYFKIRVASIGGWCLTNLNCRIGSPTK